MTATLPPSQRNAYIDSLRGLSIFGVVCIHFAGSFVTTDTFAWSPSFYLGLILNQGFIFAVPLFVFLSGYLAGASRRQPALGEYYLGRLTRIGLPYLVVSVLSFYFLNHYQTWQALPDSSTKLSWLLKRVFFVGVEPTLYFIPLILQLYVLQPALRALPGAFNRLLPALGVTRIVAFFTAALLVLHVTLGVLCYRGVLDYYTWGRPNVLFWAFYFFAGLHFKTLTATLTPQLVRRVAWVALACATAAMAWNFLRLTDRDVVGEHFERNLLDFAYVRPEMLIYDLGIVVAAAAGIVLGLNFRATLVSYLGRYTLEIYLWHILVLYFGAWRYGDALANCRQVPEVMIAICAVTALAIAFTKDGWDRMWAFIHSHRLVLVKEPAATGPTQITVDTSR